MGLSENSFFHINEVSYLFQNLREGLYGTKGTEAPDGEKIDAAGVLHAKHILIKAVPVTDESGNVTDDGMASALEKANALYDEITVAEDPMTRFEELMNENSEDVDSSGNVNGGADGYTFGPGEMVTERWRWGRSASPSRATTATISSSVWMPTMRPARASTRT